MRRLQILLTAILTLGPLTVFAVPIVEDFETMDPFLGNGEVHSGMEFITGLSPFSIVQDVSGNDVLNVAGVPDVAGGGVLRLNFVGGPVASISADVSNGEFPIVIDAYDAGGTLLGSSGTGGLDNILYDTLSFNYASASIAYVIIHDSGFDYFVDNITWDMEVRVAQVPEPGTLALLGLGLFAAGLSRRRRKA